MPWIGTETRAILAPALAVSVWIVFACLAIHEKTLGYRQSALLQESVRLRHDAGVVDAALARLPSDDNTSGWRQPWRALVFPSERLVVAEFSVGSRPDVRFLLPKDTDKLAAWLRDGAPPKPGKLKLLVFETRTYDLERLEDSEMWHTRILDALRQRAAEGY